MVKLVYIHLLEFHALKIILETLIARENTLKSVCGGIGIPNDVHCECKYVKYVDTQTKIGRKCLSSSYVIVVESRLTIFYF